MNSIEKDLLLQTAELHEIPQVGAFSIRENGKIIAKNNDDGIEILSKKNRPGIDIKIKSGTQNKSVHIPVLLSQAGLQDKVYNNFYIGNNCDVLIVAGCGIHNTSKEKTSHDGIHSFKIGDNCTVKYVEKHVGLGKKTSKKEFNPITEITLGKNSTFEMQTSQLDGVTESVRTTSATVGENSKLIINEKLLTTGTSYAKTIFNVDLVGENAKVDVVSRSVAQDKSSQEFESTIIGKSTCFGHVECDGILCDKATISSTPKIIAKNPNANLVHEAALGKISAEQQDKLMTLGLSKEQAEQTIIKGFLGK